MNEPTVRLSGQQPASPRSDDPTQLLTQPHGPAPSPPLRPTRLGRRVLLGGGLAAGAVATIGAGRVIRDLWANSDSVTDPDNPGGDGDGGGGDVGGCVAASSLVRKQSVGSARLVYEINQAPASFGFDPGFHQQLVRWLADWNSTSRYRGVKELWSYGAHVNKDGCRSWHASGRALDISRLRAGDTLLVSCRSDLWGEVSAQQRSNLTRRYWTLAASLHLHFAYVLTHHFDALHANHIHVDNGISGSGMSTFNRRSRVQNQAVQAICQSIWGRAGDVTGDWADTRAMAGPVLAELGLRDLSKQATWQGFLRASVARG